MNDEELSRRVSSVLARLYPEQDDQDASESPHPARRRSGARRQRLLIAASVAAVAAVAAIGGILEVTRNSSPNGPSGSGGSSGSATLTVRIANAGGLLGVSDRPVPKANVTAKGADDHKW